MHLDDKPLERRLTDSSGRGFTGWKAMALIALMLGFLWSAIIPPFKSPDEPDHLRRAYLLVNGQLLLHSQDCDEEGYRCKNGKTASGGEIDAGLKEYLAVRDGINFGLRTVNEFDEDRAGGFRWQGRDVFDITPGTAYYFPLVYAPQAIGLALSKALGLRLERSYYVARFFSLLATVLVLGLAFSIFIPSPVTLALLLLPMSLYQAVSTSLDGFSTALAILALACFARITSSPGDKKRWGLFMLMLVSLFLVGTSRAHLLPMLLMPCIAAYRMRKLAAWLGSAFLSVAVLVWMWLAIPSAVDLRVDRGLSTGQILLHYLKEPGELVQVFYRTLTDQGLMTGYGKSFLGMFFSLYLSPYAYVLIGVLLFGIILISLPSWQQWRGRLLERSALLLIGCMACFLAFLAMLLTWTPHPAQTIQGVQGRYFLVPAIMVFAGACSWSAPVGWRARGASFLLTLLFGVGFWAGTVRMLDGFYTPWMTMTKESSVGEQVVSKVLSPQNPISLQFEDLAAETGDKRVIRIGVRLATYLQQLRGTAKLQYLSDRGLAQEALVNLASVHDNQYVYVDVPPGNYVGGSLSVVSGNGGASVWQYHLRNATASPGRTPIQSCVVFVFEDGSKRTMAGCDPAK